MERAGSNLHGVNGAGRSEFRNKARQGHAHEASNDSQSREFELLLANEVQLTLELNMIKTRPLAVVLTVALLSASTVAAFAQATPSPTAPAVVEVDENDDDGFDMGWLGLLGLAGLLGLRGRRHDTTNTRTTTSN
ncbi:WGxxGxxG family protein [Devosia sp. 1635]|uniref:WGxxGxxG family protein n=1 Tax=Devosia sp. 1635 TaxID=2726066 RepID=UPI0020C04F0C|nr:WGxxGxxG family protein [Devosia sp. 1635]